MKCNSHASLHLYTTVLWQVEQMRQDQKSSNKLSLLHHTRLAWTNVYILFTEYRHWIQHLLCQTQVNFLRYSPGESRHDDEAGHTTVFSAIVTVDYLMNQCTCNATFIQQCSYYCASQNKGFIISSTSCPRKVCSQNILSEFIVYIHFVSYSARYHV